MSLMSHPLCTTVQGGASVDAASLVSWEATCTMDVSSWRRADTGHHRVARKRSTELFENERERPVTKFNR